MFKFISNMMRNAINEAVDKAIERLSRDKYTENIFEMITGTKKVGAINMVENVMRASQGKPPGRPLGSHIHFSPWEKLLFNPVHLWRFPTPEQVAISSSVVIGKKAKRPLEISIPIMIAAMSYGGALSKSAKIALAKGASMVGTATNTGESGLLEEERQAAKILIGQYNRGGWLNDPAQYKRLDAIEIQLGQGAQGSSPQRTKAENIGQEYQEVFRLADGEDAVIHSRLPGVDTQEQFIALVRQLREETGVPVGLKIAATHYLERELEVALKAGVDFVTVDGAEGGTHAAAPILEDDLGLPTMFAVRRAAKYLASKGAGDVSLIATGGLVTPGHFLKAMALGADAVYTGTAALIAMIGDQMTHAVPFETPVEMVVYSGKMTDKLDIDRSVTNLTNFLNACVREMELVAYSAGKTRFSEFTTADLCTLDPFLSRALGVELGYISSEEQQAYFAGLPVMPGDRYVPLHEEQQTNDQRESTLH
jgi:glutamate synthase domain-containing protein 2